MPQKPLTNWFKHLTNGNYTGETYIPIIQSTLPYPPSLFVSMPAEKLSQIRQVHSNLEEDPETVREEFDRFLMAAVDGWTDRQHREEGSITDCF